jgi:hypothetical protein
MPNNSPILSFGGGNKPGESLTQDCNPQDQPAPENGLTLLHRSRPLGVEASGDAPTSHRRNSQGRTTWNPKAKYIGESATSCYRSQSLGGHFYVTMESIDLTWLIIVVNEIKLGAVTAVW